MTNVRPTHTSNVVRACWRRVSAARRRLASALTRELSAISPAGAYRVRVSSVRGAREMRLWQRPGNSKYGGGSVTRHIGAGVLDVAYEETGPVAGTPVVLLHGFPYDVHAFDDVTPLLVARGCRVIVPYLRGYGGTRFLSTETLRSGQQAVLGHDLLALLDALSVPAAVLGGYDWGGRAACIVAALWPERVRGLVSCGGYNIQDIASSGTPRPPDAEHRYWYQYYFHGER